jgi:hypothetical protein
MKAKTKQRYSKMRRMPHIPQALLEIFASRVRMIARWRFAPEHILRRNGLQSYFDFVQKLADSTAESDGFTGDGRLVWLAPLNCYGHITRERSWHEIPGFPPRFLMTNSMAPGKSTSIRRKRYWLELPSFN